MKAKVIKITFILVIMLVLTNLSTFLSFNSTCKADKLVPLKPGDILMMDLIPNQPGILPLYYIEGDSNDHGAMYMGDNICEQNLLIKFDLSIIKPMTSITSATLNLYYDGSVYEDAAGDSLDAFKILNDWDEMIVDYHHRPLISSTVSDSEIVPTSAQWMSWDVTVDVRQFINNPGLNHGWEIKDTTYVDKNVAYDINEIPEPYFKSKESGRSPYLTVTSMLFNFNFYPTDDAWIGSFDQFENTGDHTNLYIRNRGNGSEYYIEACGHVNEPAVRYRDMTHFEGHFLDFSYLRVNATDEQIENAMQFAFSRYDSYYQEAIYPPFGIKCNDPDDPNPFHWPNYWYCFELVWASYRNCNGVIGEGIEIDANGRDYDAPKCLPMWAAVWGDDVLFAQPTFCYDGFLKGKC